MDQDLLQYLPPMPIERGGIPFHFVDDNFQAAFPRLYALLAVAKGLDTPQRQPASLTIFVSNKRLSVCISDRYTCQKCFVTLDTERPFWDQIEAFLGKPECEWKSDKGKVVKRS